MTNLTTIKEALLNAVDLEGYYEAHQAELNQAFMDQGNSHRSSLLHLLVRELIKSMPKSTDYTFNVKEQTAAKCVEVLKWVLKKQPRAATLVDVCSFDPESLLLFELPNDAALGFRTISDKFQSNLCEAYRRLHEASKANILDSLAIVYRRENDDAKVGVEVSVEELMRKFSARYAPLYEQICKYTEAEKTKLLADNTPLAEQHLGPSKTAVMQWLAPEKFGLPSREEEAELVNESTETTEDDLAQLAELWTKLTLGKVPSSQRSRAEMVLERRVARTSSKGIDE
jgi:hypothetical protein